MTTVAAAVMVRDGKVLIARRKTDLSNGGRWEFPGGKLKAGETPRNCLKRELMEELGITVTVSEKMGTGAYEDGCQSIRLLFYRTEWDAGRIRLRDHSEIRWVAARQLKNFDLTPADRDFAKFLELAEK